MAIGTQMKLNSSASASWRAAQAVGGLEMELRALLGLERDEAALDAVLPGERIEHVVERRLEVQGARERLADLQERGKPLVLARRGRALGQRASDRFAGRHGIRDPVSPPRGPRDK
jgi:beta-phosphoglucomutase-like phosphatase (HAD superfamily)